MDERDIAKDRELCEKATPGPWKAFIRKTHYIIESPTAQCSIVYEKRYPGIPDETWRQQCADARFIAESRTALPYYISMLEVALDELERSCPTLDCPEHGDCRKCWRDYLYKEAKEDEVLRALHKYARDVIQKAREGEGK